MSPTFILAPTPSASSTPLPSSSALNLLPFSLGPTSKPHTSSTAPLSTYFRPRPAPVGIPGVEAGTPVAVFRGRQVAGQSVPVPRGYKGLVITADRPDVVKYASATADEESGGDVKRGRTTRRGQWPLTPATSTASVPGTSGSSAVGDADDGTELRRSPKQGSFAKLKQRVRGAGQTALARPKRGVVKTGTKRYRLDSDDDEDEDISPGPSTDIPPPTPSIIGTPAKRPRSSLLPSTPTRQSPRLSQPRTPAPQSSRKLPAIILQEATPLKEPLPPPPPHLRRKKNKADYVIPGSPGAVPEADVGMETTEESIKEEQEEEPGIIPSPATENDPPTFPIPSRAQTPEAPKVEDESKVATRSIEQDISGMMEISGAVRVLRPIATFDAIMLWTPDGPLAGYKPVDGSAVMEAGDGTETDVKGKGKAKEEEVEAEEAGKAEEAGPKVREGWWAPGGSGEGGDEVVRAMGEWLGLVEMLNKPVYLDGLRDEDDDDEDDA